MWLATVSNSVNLFEKKFCAKNAFNPTHQAKTLGFTGVSAGRIRGRVG